MAKTKIKKNKVELKQLAFWLPTSIYDDFVAICNAEMSSVSNLLRIVIRDYVNERKNDKNI